MNAVYIDVEIKNEAGNQVISQGRVVNLTPPVTVTRLTNPQPLQVHNEYQVGPTNGGPYVGLMCTAVNVATNTATFD